MVTIKNLNVIKNGHAILKNINLKIMDGEKVAIIGSSGAGKTTLFNILAKLDEDYKGQIVIDSMALEAYRDNKSYARKVGIISQGVHLIENLRVVHNVLTGHLKDWHFFKSLLSLIKPREKASAEEALKRVDMIDHINKKTGLLSGGEKQRVAIAKMIVQNPDIILADEPIAALDPKLSKEVLEVLVNQMEDKTIIAILHHVDYAKEYFDRIIGIKEGQIHFDTSAENLTKDMIGDLYE